MTVVCLPTVDADTPPFTDAVCICISSFEPSVTVSVYTSIKCPAQTDGIYVHTPHTSSNMKTFTTFSLILLSTSTYVNALPLAVGNFTVPLIRLESTGAYLKGAANASRARARFLKSRTPVGPSTMSMLSSAPYFVVEVGVGSEPVVYQHLLVDTGSSLTWL